MPNFLDTLKQYGGVLGTGLMRQAAPGIASGFINRFFHEWKVDVARITQDVQSGRSLLDQLSPDQQREFAIMAKRVGALDFITPAFLVNSIKKDFPTVASLFVNWPEAAEWLNKQVNDLKQAISDIE